MHQDIVNRKMALQTTMSL